MDTNIHNLYTAMNLHNKRQMIFIEKRSLNFVRREGWADVCFSQALG